MLSSLAASAASPPCLAADSRALATCLCLGQPAVQSGHLCAAAQQLLQQAHPVWQLIAELLELFLCVSASLLCCQVICAQLLRGFYPAADSRTDLRIYACTFFVNDALASHECG